MFDVDDRIRDVSGNAVDLSFSQILEVHAWQQQRRRKQPASSITTVQLHPDRQEHLAALDEEGEESDDSSAGLAPSADEETSTEDEDWAIMDVAQGKGNGDMYRFVQPRRLSSWVQDDAVNACFQCHTHFTLLLRKHHCR